MVTIDKKSNIYDLIVVGGGASGFMSAITAAEKGVKSILILESSSNTLSKVRVSGGGRCNVTNATWDNNDLVLNYPRGSLSLKGTFSRFSTYDAVSWFYERGLELKTESDGRMFPSSNTSEEVINLFRRLSRDLGIDTQTNNCVKLIKKISSETFLIHNQHKESFLSKRVLLTTGGCSKGMNIASSLGHNIIPPVPSLFSFTLRDKFLISCSGITVNNVLIKLFCSEKVYVDKGNILITHRGISGPCVLRLSAFAARNLSNDFYSCKIQISWISDDLESISSKFDSLRVSSSNIAIGTYSPFDNLPKRLWRKLLEQSNLDANIKFSSFSKRYESIITEMLLKTTLTLKGRGPFSDEFVTAGGIHLADINHKSMESKKINGLYFAGEILDIDGLTGGFNFQHCWSSGWIAGKSIAKSLFISNI